ncbi:MAG: glycosyltransferase family 2 protein [Berryella intestinalis]|nr:glycosyltransferase family 2 protein [Berryella intestinalis]
MNKVLTVAIPSYNVEQYLRASLDSYCCEPIDERLEVLIVDDGSTDATAAIALEYVQRFPDLFSLVSKDNGGHGSAVNAGIDFATGRYFRVIDGDDRICSANIPTLLDALETCTDDLVIDVKREVTFSTGESQRFDLPANLPRGESVPFEDICLRTDIESSFQIHTLSMRTDFLRERAVKLLEHTFYVDYELVVKVSAWADTVCFLDLEVCNYYVGNIAQSVSPANYVRRWDDHGRVCGELLAFATRTPLGATRKRFVESRVDLLVNTHYNIALIFDEDRERGLERARWFRDFLTRDYPAFEKRSRMRYYQARILHHLGFDAERLDRLMGRASS